jgi:hypothetical protein
MRIRGRMVRVLAVAIPGVFASTLAVAAPGTAGLAAMASVRSTTPWAATRPWAATAPWAAAAGRAAGAGRAATSPPVTSPASIRAAAAAPAPLVPDLGPNSKVGLKAPPMSASMRAANAVRQAAARLDLRLAARGAGPDAACAKGACRDGLPAARVLAATQEPQHRDYFCGPATVSEMLAQMGTRLSQFAAARELGTTTNGTDWSDASGYPVPNVLNDNQSRNDYVAVALPWSPTTRQTQTFETDLVADINHDGGVPLAGDAYEVAGGPHLVGHPLDQTIMHWFDIRGYAEHGAVTDYEDSVHDASSVAWDVPAYSSMPTSTIVEILGARGYDW